MNKIKITEAVRLHSQEKEEEQNMAKIMRGTAIIGNIFILPGAIILCGGAEAVRSGFKLAEGEIDGGEFVRNVARKSVGGGVAATGGMVVGGAVAATIASATAPVWVAPAVAIGTTVVVGKGIKRLWDGFWED
jgi:tetrahydromethanopterin S-methyltransferase subunit C